jgi:hypothetical protein
MNDGANGLAASLEVRETAVKAVCEPVIGVIIENFDRRELGAGVEGDDVFGNGRIVNVGAGLGRAIDADGGN